MTGSAGQPKLALIDASVVKEQAGDAEDSGGNHGRRTAPKRSVGMMTRRQSVTTATESLADPSVNPIPIYLVNHPELPRDESTTPEQVERMETMAHTVPRFYDGLK